MKNTALALLASALCAVSARAQVVKVFAPEGAIQGAAAAAQAVAVQPKLDCSYILRWGTDGAMMGSANLISFTPGDGDLAANGTLAAAEGKKLVVQATVGADGKLNVDLTWRRTADGAVLGRDRETYAPKTLSGFAFETKFDSSEPAAVLAKNPETPMGTLPISRIQTKCSVRVPR